MKIQSVGISMLILLIAFMNFLPSLVRANDVIYSNEVVVLVYHHIDDQVQGSVTISTKLFEKQLEAMQRKGYHFISMDEFKSFKSEGTAIHENAILVTFDDGYKSFYTNAFPILKKMRIPAVNFVITKDLDNPAGTLLPSLSREEIRKMRKEYAGIDFQCHSDGLHAMSNGKPLLTNKITQNGVTETDDEFKVRVLNDSRTGLSKLIELNGSKTVDSYAYPFGSYDDQTITYLQEVGVKFAFTTKSGITTKETDPMQIPRINAGSPFIRAHSINNLIKQAKRHQIHPIQS
ncbi:polysaccharide deacetylase family protein [Paenibacillus sp. V4I7]|uniref:polysaccharide deacetylase family protein n=1 Tax=Paenibacillus sp. V4I7 TaxID=3042307 RepID=UPI002785E117|nr:polysaccharide deacetylase family protein [Paenibacillus sp. V4I7]MDQ0898341.1 peptidoglycan/xylan/chitin deacetylase (PgdA/CDA1 family) [Paenibacillus sp. V4I7]